MQGQQKSELTPGRTLDVILHIQRLIEDGTLQPGCRIPAEREFARELKISRASVRIGIGYLAGMGVMEVRRGVGTFLAEGLPRWNTPSLHLLGMLHGFGPGQMLEARSVIEGALAVLAAERGNAEHQRVLAEDVAEMYASVDCEEDFLAHEMHFHRTVAEAAGNPVLAASMDTITTALFAHFSERLLSRFQRRESANLHREIYRAIRQRRAAEARQWMESLLAPEKSFAARHQDVYNERVG